MDTQARTELLALLRQEPRGAANRQGPRVRQLCQELERAQPADLAAPGALELLEGGWELRWSSSRQPYLAVGPWLENLQLLAPSQGRGMNLLRLPGPLAPLAGIAVEAAIAINPGTPAAGPLQRVQVRFQRGGWLGPQVGRGRLQLLRGVQQAFPAWLDITVLDQDLRICRGNAGTLFALVRRPDLQLADLLLPLTSAPGPESPAGSDPV
ncbi:MAG: PAP fibrillin [Cyanobacteria bacterium M_surface_10_m2_119]|nr:PAP fibrillin [Cyanobacteria bacterium M_surface_10_m2_119]